MFAKLHSISFKLFIVYFVLLVVVLFAVLGTNYANHYRTYVSLVEEYGRGTVARVSNEIDTYLMEIMHWGDTVIYSERMMGCLTDAYLYPYVEESVLTLTNLSDMDELLTLVYNAKINVSNIYFFCSTGRVLFLGNRLPSKQITNLMDSSEYMETTLYKTTHALLGKKLVYWGEWNLLTNDNEEFVCVRPMYNSYHKEIAVMVVVLNNSDLQKLVKDADINNDIICIFDDNDCIRYQSSLIGDKMLAYIKGDQKSIRQMNGENYYVTIRRSNNVGWTVVHMVSLSGAFNPAGAYLNVLLTVLAVFSVAIITFYGVSVLLVRPILRLEDGMKCVANGNFDVRMPFREGDEIAALYNGFNGMVEKLQTLVDQVYIAQLKQQEAQIVALQTQINPHFLYNTLDSIQLVAILNNDFKASKMITSLSKLFRYSMEIGRIFVTVEEELEYTANYVYLQGIRFENAFQLYNDVPEEFLTCYIPRLTMQPLVENCIQHGLRTYKSGGKIHISAYEEDNMLHMVVQDNGKGMMIEQLEHIRALLEHDEQVDLPINHIGLGNINLRLRKLYGTASGVYIAKSDCTGTTIEVICPINRTTTGNGNDENNAGR